MSHLDEGQLHALLDGELDDAERTAAEAHLAACPECRRLHEEARSFLAEADELIAEVQVPPRVGPRARPPVLPLPRSGRRLPWNYLAWAATVMVAVGLGWYASEFRYLTASRAAATDEIAADKVSTTAPAPGPRTVVEPMANQASQPAERRIAVLAETTSRNARPATPPVVATAPTAPAQEPPKDLPAGRAAPLPPASQDLAAKQALTGGNAPAAPPSEGRAAEGKINAETGFSQAAPAGAPLAPGALAARKAVAAARLRPVDLATAVRMLGGTIRLVDGLTPTGVLAGPGAAVPGADPEANLVRVVYEDPPARELWLDQQRSLAREEADRRADGARPATTLLLGDTLIAPEAGGARSLRWIDQDGFRLGLTGFLPADSLQSLARRVQ
jgi:anti-sigma factor ChrR (cupin superfamily)